MAAYTFFVWLINVLWVSFCIILGVVSFLLLWLIFTDFLTAASTGLTIGTIVCVGGYLLFYILYLTLDIAEIWTDAVKESKRKRGVS